MWTTSDRSLLHNLKARIDHMERHVGKIPSRINAGGGGGGSWFLRNVDSLPAIPSSGADAVNWVGHGVWFSWAGAPVWFPVHWTTDSGVPIT